MLTLAYMQPDRVMEFCNNNDLQLIVRAHECVMDGFERFAQGHLITLFSATNYCGKMLQIFWMFSGFLFLGTSFIFMQILFVLFSSFLQVLPIMLVLSWYWVEILLWFQNLSTQFRQFHRLKIHLNGI